MKRDPMSLNLEAVGSKADTLKLLAALVLVGAGVGAFYFYAEYSLLMRVLGLLVVTGGAVAIALQSELGRSVWQFVKESRTEVRKVVWPTRTETIRGTLAVLAVVILIGMLLWLMDMVFLWLVRLIAG
jgi:preprotein translocase, SecE subunit, bacterial